MKKFGKKENKNIFAVLAIFLFCNICLFSYTPTPAFATVSTYATTLTYISASNKLLGSGTESDPYQIASASDLQYLNQYAQPKNYKLLNNIDLKGKYFTPIRNSNGVFDGVFDGNGFELKNWVYELTSDTSNNHYGLFASVSASGIIKNLTMSNCNINFSGLQNTIYVGMIAGSCNGGKIISCKSINSTIKIDRSGLTSPYAGGIVGFMTGSSTITKCTNNYGSIYVDTTYKNYVGGIIGCANSSNVIIQNCINYSTVTSTTILASCWLGGIIGYSNSDITLCLNKGKISGKSSISTLLIAGIVGESSADISQCANEAQISTTLTSPTTYAGGIVGRVSKYSSQLNNTSSGNVSTPMREEPGDDDIGGGGSISNADASITDCYNKGTLSINSRLQSSGAVGGIIGSVNNDVIVDVTRCYNIGQIDSLIGFEDKNAIYDNPEKEKGGSNALFNYFCTSMFDYRKKQGGIIGDKISGTCNVKSTCKSTSTTYKFDIYFNYDFQAGESCDIKMGDNKWYDGLVEDYIQKDQEIRTWSFNKTGYTPDTDFKTLINNMDENYTKSAEYFSQNKKYPYKYGGSGGFGGTLYVESLAMLGDYDFALHNAYNKYYDLQKNISRDGSVAVIPDIYKNPDDYGFTFEDGRNFYSNIYMHNMLPAYYYDHFDLSFINSKNSDTYFPLLAKYYEDYIRSFQYFEEYESVINKGTILEIAYVNRAVNDTIFYYYQMRKNNYQGMNCIYGDPCCLYQWIYVEDVNPEGNALSTTSDIKSEYFGSNWATNASINGGYPYLKNLYW